MEAGLAPYLLSIALIAWAMYFYLTQRFVIAAMAVFLGFLTMVVPIVLMVPFLLCAKRRNAVVLLTSFLLLSAFVFTGAIGVFGTSLVLSKVSDLLSAFGTWGFYPAFGLLGGIVLAGELLCFVLMWSVYSSRLLPVSSATTVYLAAELLLLIPLVIGDDFAGVFILSSCLIAMVIFTKGVFDSHSGPSVPRLAGLFTSLGSSTTGVEPTPEPHAESKMPNVEQW
jgi:hypothetical protein